MNRRQALWTIAAGGSFGGTALGCLWDTDTLASEVAVNPSALDLILGQFPHHGDAYYRLRIERVEKSGGIGVTELNDIAVAHVRLGEFKEAWKNLDAAHGMDPEHYETLSNMGVTAKKEGDFHKGANFIAQALAIKPEGHMGLGDWYLKSLQWRSIYEDAGLGDPPLKNFLGSDYDKSFSEGAFGIEGGRSQMKPHDRYPKLVRNDQGFADGFLVYGDYLAGRGDLHLAFLAYTRASLLGHQNPEEVKRRQDAYLRYMNIDKANRRSVGRAGAISVARAENAIKVGEKWLEQFKKVESELLLGEKDERRVSFLKVLSAMGRRGIKRVGE